jgi:hypothetical protein
MVNNFKSDKKGIVYLNVTKIGFPGNTITLKIKGIEKCSWEEK